MAAPLASVHQERAVRLADPALHSSVRKFVRGRVPQEEVDDVVQTTLIDALAAAEAPVAQDEFRRWVFGIARNKVADVFRRRQRNPEKPASVSLAAPEAASPLEARELLQWVDREVASHDAARSTLEWMLREGDGDSLEDIAKDASLPAPRVRQRVSRLRRHLRSRWAILSAGLGVALLLGIGWLLLHQSKQREANPNLIVKEEPKQPREPTPQEKARFIREVAFDRCARGRYQDCLEEFDRAKALDPSGDLEQRVQDARRAALNAQLQAPLKTMEPKLQDFDGKNSAPAPSNQKQMPRLDSGDSKLDSKEQPVQRRKVPSNIDAKKASPITKSPAKKEMPLDWKNDPESDKK